METLRGTEIFCTPAAGGAARRGYRARAECEGQVATPGVWEVESFGGGKPGATVAAATGVTGGGRPADSTDGGAS